MRVLKYIVPLLLLGLFLLWLARKEQPLEAVVPPEEVVEVAPDTLRLLFGGDVMVHATQYEAAWREGGDSVYNFHPPFVPIKELIGSADLSIANLEIALGGKPYSGYPLFSSPPEIVEALKEVGFDLLFTANNHSADKGRKGIAATIEKLDESGLLHTGTFVDSATRAEQYPLFVECKGIRLAFLNYTYGTNGMPVYKPQIVNRIDTTLILSDLAKARRGNPDYIITCMHWGYEYQEKQNAEQRALARFLAENGTDLIVGSHPHVVQPYEEIVNAQEVSVPVIYSVGNFISNQQWRRSDGGILFELLLVKNEGRTLRVSCAYEPFWVMRSDDAGSTFYRMIPVRAYLNDSARYALNATHDRKIRQFYDDTRATLSALDFSDFYTY